MAVARVDCDEPLVIDGGNETRVLVRTVERRALQQSLIG